MNLLGNKTTIFLLLATLTFFTAGCVSKTVYPSPDKQIETDTLTKSTQTEEVATTETERTTQSTNTETTDIYTIEKSTKDLSAERQIVEAIVRDMDGVTSSYEASFEHNALVEEHTDYLMRTAEAIPERILGKISNEDDLIEKTRAVWVNILGSTYIEHIESDYIEVNGEKMRYERDHPPYTVNYYEEYDVWLIEPHAPSGVREDGVKFATPSEPPYFIIRGEDGMILGALI